MGLNFSLTTLSCFWKGFWRFLQRSKSSWKSLEGSFPEENQAENGKLGERLCVSSGFHLFQITLIDPYLAGVTQPGILPCITNGVFPAISINKDVLFINTAISDSVPLNVNF